MRLLSIAKKYLEAYHSTAQKSRLCRSGLCHYLALRLSVALTVYCLVGHCHSVLSVHCLRLFADIA